MDIKGYTFNDDYTNVEDYILLAELDDIAQLLSNQSNYEWNTRHDEISIQFNKIKNAISDRLQQQEHNKDILK